ncbi:MAG: hypothetical protein JOS17DRAFT_62329 [Linnemannia elongata]|nr:MAG: hypothetical protein JOS17DRAFT_62329 [Linnemannia elongata]
MQTSEEKPTVSKMKSSRRRNHHKHAAQGQAQAQANNSTPSFPHQRRQSTSQGLRPDHGNRQAVDFQTAELMLHDAEDTLNKVEDCSRLPPALDMLASLSKQHPAAWQARFGDIVDLLVGWFVDKNTASTVKKQIGDLMGSFTVQWLDAAEFGQDLLEIFITDIENIVSGEAPSGEDDDRKDAASMETAASLISCFSIISKALVEHASQAVTRMAHLQERALDMLVLVRKAISSSDTQGNTRNDIQLTLIRNCYSNHATNHWKYSYLWFALRPSSKRDYSDTQSRQPGLVLQLATQGDTNSHGPI